MQNRLMGPSRTFWLWIFIFMAFAAWISYSEFSRKPAVSEINSTELYQSIEKGEINYLEINPDNRMVRGEYKSGKKFAAVVGDFENLEKIAVGKGVAVRVVPRNEPSAIWTILLWLLPVAVMFWFIWRMVSAQRMGGGNVSNIGVSRGFEDINPDLISTRFSDVAGCDEVKEELKMVVEFLKNPQQYNKLGARVPRGILFIGPPGTGKTLMARAVAGEAGVAFLSAQGSEFMELFVGMGARKVRELFEFARARKKCVVFIDEIDAVAVQRNGSGWVGHEERNQTLGQLLAEMDGFGGNSGVLVIGATNSPDLLDKALIRPGRFDEQLVFPLPDVKGREAILKVHCQKIIMDPKIDLAEIAKNTPLGLSGADIANVVNRAALIATQKRHPLVSKDDFLDGLDWALYGTKRKIAMSDKERSRTAYHEAGHTLVAMLLKDEGADPVQKVTIVPRGMAGGATQFMPTEDHFNRTDKELILQLKIAMGGGAAEEIQFGDRSTGTHNDFEKATEIAKSMVCLFGMSEKLGKAVHVRRSQFLGADLGSIDCSPETQKLIDEEVRRLLDHSYSQAKGLLENPENQAKLKTLATALLEKETLTREEVEKILASA